METKTRIAYYYSIAAVTVVLLMSEVRGDKMLLHMFEKALVNSSYSLYTLQNFYFNPLPRYSYGSLCLRVDVILDGDIINPSPLVDCDAAFAIYEDINSIYNFSSKYVLQLLHNDGGTSELIDLLSYSGSGNIFFMMDPTFCMITKALAKSLDFNSKDDTVMIDNKDDYIEILISGKLENMPCRDDAVHDMRMLLVWVSIFGASLNVPHTCRLCCAIAVYQE